MLQITRNLRNLSRQQDIDLFGKVQQGGINCKAGEVHSLKAVVGPASRYPNEIYNDHILYCRAASKGKLKHNEAMDNCHHTFWVKICSDSNNYLWGKGRVCRRADGTPEQWPVRHADGGTHVRWKIELVGHPMEPMAAPLLALPAPQAQATTHHSTAVVQHLDSRYEEKFSMLCQAVGWELASSPSFHLQSGHTYTPDGYLPHLGWQVEIKPIEPSLQEMARCEVVAGPKYRQPILLVYGEMKAPYVAATKRRHNGQLLQSKSTGLRATLFQPGEPRKEGLVLLDNGSEQGSGVPWAHWGTIDDASDPRWNTARLLDAYKTARAAPSSQ